MSNKRFNFRAWYKDPYSDEPKPKMFYCVEDAYDHIRGIPAQCFGDLLDEDEFVLMQCTGLTDKNGNLIYEGDIVELTRSRNCGYCSRGSRLVVSWNTFNCCGFGFGAIGNLTKKCADNCIVIGNIYENPELLEE